MGVQVIMPKEIETTIQRFSAERNRLAIIIPKKLSDDSACVLKTGDKVKLKLTDRGMNVILAE